MEQQQQPHPSPRQQQQRDDWVYTREAPPGATVDDPLAQITVEIHNGKLITTIAGDAETVALPGDAFTAHPRAEWRRHALTVTVPRRDPEGAAMLEKRLFDPDTRPRRVDVSLPHGSPAMRKLAAKHDPRRGPTPAQAELSAQRGALYASAPEAGRYALPAANMGSSVATANPVVFGAGGAPATASQGETVVPVAGSAETKAVGPDTARRDQRAEKQRRHMEGQEEEGEEQEEEEGEEGAVAGLAERVARAGLDEALPAPPRSAHKVLFGQREKELDREFASAGGGAGGGVGAPAGAEGEEAEGEEEGPESALVDFAAEKVGMERRPLRAADAYVDSTRREPLSTMKAPGAAACDVCGCNPCQCDKLRATYRVPIDLTPQETKRGGKPHLHTKAKPVTGANSHAARDFRMHAKPRSEARAGAGARDADFDGGVGRALAGGGSWEEREKALKEGPHYKGASHTGGAEIPLHPEGGGGVAQGALSKGRTVG